MEVIEFPASLEVVETLQLIKRAVAETDRANGYRVIRGHANSLGIFLLVWDISVRDDQTYHLLLLAVLLIRLYDLNGLLDSRGQCGRSAQLDEGNGLSVSLLYCVHAAEVLAGVLRIQKRTYDSILSLGTTKSVNWVYVVVVKVMENWCQCI